MFTSLANVTLLIKDYDEAIKWWTEVAGLEVRMDGAMPGDDYRFVTVGVRGQYDGHIVLHKADSFDDAKSNVHGLLFHTNDCREM